MIPLKPVNENENAFFIFIFSNSKYFIDRIILLQNGVYAEGPLVENDT